MKTLIIFILMFLSLYELSSQTKRIYHRRHSGSNKSWQTNSKISKPKTSSHNFGIAYHNLNFSTIDSVILLTDKKCIQFYNHLKIHDTLYNYNMENINKLKAKKVKIIDLRNPKLE